MKYYKTLRADDRVRREITKYEALIVLLGSYRDNDMTRDMLTIPNHIMCAYSWIDVVSDDGMVSMPGLISLTPPDAEYDEDGRRVDETRHTLWDLSEEERRAQPLADLIRRAHELEALRSEISQWEDPDPGDPWWTKWNPAEKEFLQAMDDAWDHDQINDELYSNLCSIAFYDYCDNIPNYLEW